MKLYRAQAEVILHAICRQSHHYYVSQADWLLLILQPMRLLAQHLFAVS